MRAGHAIATFHLVFASAVTANPFKITDTFIGYGFLDAFTWWNGTDPTHGRVNYVDQVTAMETNLSYASDSKFIMRADSFATVPPEARGRDSVRISSNEAYGNMLMILDVAHMPEGCATWPAFWTTSKAGPWPHGGEIDVIEGVNLQSTNIASLHTTPQCNMPQNRNQTGETISTTCDSSVNNNQGCGTSFTTPNSYGTSFNENSGGWYILERSPDGVRVWFYSRHDTDVPPEIMDGWDVVDSSGWKVPDTEFQWDNCDYMSHFDDHQVIFDLTFCGDWAGSAFSSPLSGCGPGSCNDYVDNNPDAFLDSYWEINSLRIYVP